MSSNRIRSHILRPLPLMSPHSVSKTSRLILHDTLSGTSENDETFRLFPFGICTPRDNERYFVVIRQLKVYKCLRRTLHEKVPNHTKYNFHVKKSSRSNENFSPFL